MENLKKIKDLIELISVDTYKATAKGNHSAAIRARKNAQKIKELIGPFRKEILVEIRKYDDSKN